MAIMAPRGTNDILPGAIQKWLFVEEKMREICANFGYKEIRTPIFEHTELFQRGIGDTTDVVEKEMYTFTDRGNRSLTLRPENTASAVRAFIENKLYADTAITKLFYMGPMFRYDRPQAGRMRQFHQFGVEVLGTSSPIVDAEIIILAVEVLKQLGLTDLKLKINSVGDDKCRPVYRKNLQDFFRPNFDKLCKDCQSRFDRNPLRILDCKNETCKELSKGAPIITDSLCEECSDHFEEVKKLLDVAKIDYILDPRLVRGLDYYTKTAFEIQYNPLGAQSAVCGGGRYDGLVEEIGGMSTPGIGFAMGFERILLALEKQNLLPKFEDNCDVYIVSPKGAHIDLVFEMAIKLRELNLKTEIDYTSRSMKAQMKQANKFKAKNVVIFGEEELTRESVVLRNMQTSEQQEVKIKDIYEILKVEV
jgi:histidyl-tRNA synthetase